MLQAATVTELRLAGADSSETLLREGGRTNEKLTAESNEDVQERGRRRAGLRGGGAWVVGPAHETMSRSWEKARSPLCSS